MKLSVATERDGVIRIYETRRQVFRARPHDDGACGPRSRQLAVGLVLVAGAFQLDAEAYRLFVLLGHDLVRGEVGGGSGWVVVEAWQAVEFAALLRGALKRLDDGEEAVGVGRPGINQWVVLGRVSMAWLHQRDIGIDGLTLGAFAAYQHTQTVASSGGRLLVVVAVSRDLSLSVIALISRKGRH